MSENRDTAGPAGIELHIDLPVTFSSKETGAQQPSQLADVLLTASSYITMRVPFRVVAGATELVSFDGTEVKGDDRVIASLHRHYATLQSILKEIYRPKPARN